MFRCCVRNGNWTTSPSTATLLLLLAAEVETACLSLRRSMLLLPLVQERAALALVPLLGVKSLVPSVVPPFQWMVVVVRTKRNLDPFEPLLDQLIPMPFGILLLVIEEVFTSWLECRIEHFEEFLLVCLHYQCTASEREKKK